ncbi:bifunctional diguanylate cyclase/phosphodiesterase [Micromonospora costi]|uniref:GGDEF domain-containing protein n=1 Tax=Micromonospora costi TaxID=1530042 RepID=A0A3B0ABX4_9ACTN|nr:bifunctional diguanylate cyclase/phosphodiesterase [Micromonospora costi]RKN58032.1 GGDEF domain-containing protein [Micromonospora costi]
MLLAPPLHTLVRRRPTPEATALALLAPLVLAGAVGLLPAAAVVALAGGVGATLAGVRLSRLAARSPSRPAVLLLGAAVVAAGLTAAVPPLLSPWHRIASAAGPVAVAGLAGVGLLRLPGRAQPPARVRLRRFAEAGTPAVGLILASWLLMPRSTAATPISLVAAVALGAFGMAALSALTGAHRRPGAATCRGGVLLTLLGLVLLAALAPAGLGGRAALLAVPPLTLGMLLVAVGAGRAVAAAPGPVRSAPVWLRAVVPAAALLLATAPHVGSGRQPDRTTVLLALAVVPSLVVRELFRAADRTARSASPAAEQPRAHRPDRDPDHRAEAVPAVPEPPAAGPADRPALLRALAELADAPPPAGALLVVDLHTPGAEVVPATLRDDVLAEAVHRARAVIGPRDLVAAAGGAGFAVVTAAGPVLAYALGTRLLAALTEPYRFGRAVLRVQASIGLAEVTAHGPDDVLRQADLARRRAVQLGRDRVEWYDAFLEEQLVRRLDLERELPGAVARGELDLVYQPVVGLADRLPVGTEALLRWRSPVLGTVLPAELLPVAEDLGIVGELEWWVLDRACRQLAEWSAGNRDLWMAVNVTTRELTTPDFVARTAAILAAYDVPPDRLVVEVAEPRVGPELSTVVARLAGLRSLGVRTALDDFRAEHASLAQLRRLPIDLLKVGATLVDPTPEAPRPLIDVVVNLGDRLGVEVVVEDVESAAQLDGAYRAGCRYGQGFALARPVTAERVEAYFEEFGRRPGDPAPRPDLAGGGDLA